MTDYTTLPDDLPVPDDDGAADHLPDTAVPDLTLPTCALKVSTILSSAVPILGAYDLLAKG
jgi:hypothetical protein